MPSREQQIKKHAQRIDVGCNRDRFTLQLLGRRVLRREDLPARNRKPLTTLCMIVALHELGNAEIKQLYAVVGIFEQEYSMA